MASQSSIDARIPAQSQDFFQRRVEPCQHVLALISCTGSAPPMLKPCPDLLPGLGNRIQRPVLDMNDSVPGPWCSCDEGA